MPIQEELNELRARVDTLTTTLSDFMADHKESTTILTATLNDFMTNQKESMAILTASLKAEVDKNNKPKDTPTSNGHSPPSSPNMEIQPSIDLLKAVAQNKNEGFTEYLTRWKRIYTQIPNHPQENELVSKFVDSLEPTYQGLIRRHNFRNFRDLTAIGTSIEAGIKSGAFSKLIDRLFPGSISQNTAQVAQHDVLDILSGPAEGSRPLKKKAKREFTPLPMSYTEAFKRLNSRNLLQPLEPINDPPADDRPVWWDANAFCLYHGARGHDTERCYRLKHKIQNMIDFGVFLNPSKNSGRSTRP
jgi:hypothetical protein